MLSIYLPLITRKLVLFISFQTRVSRSLRSVSSILGGIVVDVVVTVQILLAKSGIFSPVPGIKMGVVSCCLGAYSVWSNSASFFLLLA